MRRFIVYTAVLVCVGCGMGNVSKAERYATEYAKAQYPGKEFHIICDDYDSDGNGKVSCSISVSTPTNMFRDAVECPSNWTCNWSSSCTPIKGT